VQALASASEQVRVQAQALVRAQELVPGRV